MGSMRNLVFRSALVSVALGFALPAAAEMYKWVDDNGVVTYSNTPPTTKQPKKVESVAERVSVYTPDAELARAMKPDSRRDAKIANLERQLEAEQRSRATAQQRTAQAAAERRDAAYERCISARGVDCDAIRNGTTTTATSYTDPYGAAPLPYVVVGAHVPHQPFAILSTPNSIAGVNPAPPVGISTAPPVGAQPPRNIRSNPLPTR